MFQKDTTKKTRPLIFEIKKLCCTKNIPDALLTTPALTNEVAQRFQGINAFGKIHESFNGIDIEIPQSCKKTASDKNHRPCLPLKPQEKIRIS